jgi:hypothetical protein
MGKANLEASASEACGSMRGRAVSTQTGMLDLSGADSQNRETSRAGARADLRRPAREKAMKITIRELSGRALMTLATLIYGVIPLTVDLSPTHVLNPDWPAHARVHEVWLLSVGSSIALVALYFIWCYRRDTRLGVTLAGVLGVCNLGGFMFAAATADLYGGILVDPVTAPMMPGNDMIAGVPANLFAFSLALVILLAGAVLALSATRVTLTTAS